LFVPWDGQIETIDSIGPSSVHELLYGCRMKAVLSKHPNSENCPKGINVHPNSSIGTIYHRLLEGARKNKPSNGVENWDANFAYSVLRELTDQENQKLLQNPLNAHLVPLTDNSNYHDRCMQGVFNAVRINSNIIVTSQYNLSGQSAIHSLFGAEIDVWDIESPWPSDQGIGNAPFFSIKGQIDRVTRDRNRIIIEDLKTGNIFENNSNELKNSYITQVRLYAELWINTARYRHEREYLITDIDMFIVDEADIRYPVSNQYTDTISNQVRNILPQTNQEIMNSANNNQLILALATPNQSSCRFCRHRTGCRVYLTDVQDNSGFAEDGFDLIGNVASHPIPNGVGSMDFQMKVQTASGLWLVDRINEQWIEAANLQIGDTIGIFGGSEVETDNHLPYDHFFKCSPSQHAFYQFQETQLTEPE
jgi:hypothetical protein